MLVYFRLTLLLGPPSSGKSTLLLALAGQLKSDLQVQKFLRDVSSFFMNTQAPSEWHSNGLNAEALIFKVSGKVTYNGHGLSEFVPQRTSAYVSQQDWHVAEMTVRETLDFSAHCQGVGPKYGKNDICQHT